MENKITNKKAMKLGGYSIAVSIIVLAIVIIANLAVQSLPSRFVKYSISENDIYGISDSSRDMLKNVKDDIVINIIAENEAVDSYVREYVEKYSDLSTSLSYKTVDPVVNPGFAAQYTDEAFSSSETNLILVNKSNGRSRFIPYADIYTSEYTEQEMLMYQMYYGYTPDNPTYFNIEQCLTSAVDYLTASTLPIVYYTTGHGETEMEESVISLIKADNIEYKELAISSKNEVPNDASAIIVNCPTLDFAAEEITLLEQYFSNGGNVILLSYYNMNVGNRNLSNLYGFAAKLGLEYSDVFVLEGDSSKYLGYYGPTYILPTLNSNDKYANAIASKTNILMYACHAIGISNEIPEGVTVTELMTTTDKGYAKSKITENTTVTKDENDIEGKYIIGAMSEKKSNDGISSKLAWFASPAIVSGQTANSYSNISYFMALLTDICNKDSSVTIAAKSLQITALTVPAASSNLWSIIFTAAVPLVFLVSGFIIWNRRIKR